MAELQLPCGAVRVEAKPAVAAVAAASGLPSGMAGQADPEDPSRPDSAFPCVVDVSTAVLAVKAVSCQKAHRRPGVKMHLFQAQIAVC